LGDYAEMREYWLEAGPPPHIAILMIGSALGLKFEAGEQTPYGELAPGAGPSIAEISRDIEPPRAGGDTMAASRRAIEHLTRGEGRDGIGER
jgi:hypothetical protein